MPDVVLVVVADPCDVVDVGLVVDVVVEVAPEVVVDVIDDDVVDEDGVDDEGVELAGTGVVVDVLVVDVLVVEVVVVGGAATVQVMPAGTSAELAVTTISTFQNLSTWVADAGPRVQARPTSYVPAGMSPGPKTAKLNAGMPMMSPGPPGTSALAVCWLT